MKPRLNFRFDMKSAGLLSSSYKQVGQKLNEVMAKNSQWCRAKRNRIETKQSSSYRYRLISAYTSCVLMHFGVISLPPHQSQIINVRQLLGVIKIKLEFCFICMVRRAWRMEEATAYHEKTIPKTQTCHDEK